MSEFDKALHALKRGDLDTVRSTAERALQTTPSAQWYHLLGLLHCRQGNPAEGASYLRKAAEAEPANLAHQVMLARALTDSGRAADVLAMPEPPRTIRSAGEHALWQARGEAADAVGDAAAAAAAWHIVAAVAPGDWRAWGNLGRALSLQTRWSEAAEAFVKAATLTADPNIRADALSALVQAGRHYQKALRFDDAEAVLRRAHELEPANRSAVYQLGLVLERKNRLDELAKLLDDSLAAGIGKDSIGYLWAVRAWREGRAEEAHELLSRIDPAEEPVVWTLMTKVADRLGDSDSAFAAAVAMNKAAIGRAVSAEGRKEWDRKADAYREEQRELARTITPEWGARVPVLTGAPPRRVSFLVGFPRSGTTLLDTFLLGHPKVEVLEEKQLVGAATRVSGPIEKLAGAPVQSIEKARRTYLDRLAEHVDAGFDGIVIDKFPLDMGAAPLIHAMFPGAPIIFAQRHPCDVVLSGFLQPFGIVNFSDIVAAADYYDAMMSIWEASLRALPLNVQTVVYEDLVRDPEPVLRPVVSFLGLDWDERILDHRRTATERGTIVTPSYDQVTQPISTRPSGRWKRYRKQLQPVLPLLLSWAERLGYSDDADDPSDGQAS